MRVFAAAAATVVLLASPPPAAAPGGRSPADVVRGFATAPRHAASWWGGVYTVAGGQRVRLYFSDEYPRDPAFAARWVRFVGGLPHAAEMGKLTVYLAGLDTLQRLCGPSTSACYSLDDQSITTIGADVADGPAATDVLAHEYAHHVAYNRSNAPWRAVDWGTKRWASYERVCERAQARTAFPGDEGEHYALNPGEAFAETYRAAVDRATGAPASWSLVDPTFRPTAAALALARLDASSPWSPTRERFVRRLAPAGGSLRVVVATPRDGTLTVELSAPAAARYTLSASPALKQTAARRYTTTICGARRVTLAIRTVAGGGGTLTVRLTKP